VVGVLPALCGRGALTPLCLREPGFFLVKKRSYIERCAWVLHSYLQLQNRVHRALELTSQPFVLGASKPPRLRSFRPSPLWLRESGSLLLRSHRTLHYVRGFVITTSSAYHWVVFQYHRLISDHALGWPLSPLWFSKPEFFSIQKPSYLSLCAWYGNFVLGCKTVGLLISSSHE
jgi:hypothetical protein